MMHRVINRLRRMLAPSESLLERQIVLTASMLAQLNRGKTWLDALYKAEFSGFSQWGEDGIIDWLIDRLPSLPPTFVEFGVGDYRESNTRLLLQLRNWRGLVMDGSAEHIANIQNQDIYWRYDLTAKCALLDRENINKLILDAGFRDEIGLLSVDIDGNDYWVWQAIDVINPIIVVCEYNAVFGDKYQVSIPYEATFQRTRAHYSNLYFGASLPALVTLGEAKGYKLVGTNSHGCNAFFVRNDHAQKVLDSLEGVRSYPSRIREARDANGLLTFARGGERAKIICQLPVHDFATNKIRSIEELGSLYSAEWAKVQ